MITFQHKYFPEILKGEKNVSDQKEKRMIKAILPNNFEIFLKKKKGKPHHPLISKDKF